MRASEKPRRDNSPRAAATGASAHGGPTTTTLLVVHLPACTLCAVTVVRG